MNLDLGQIIAQLIALAKTDELAALMPALAAFFTSIAADHSQINLVEQLAKLEVDLIAAQPGVATDVLKQIAADIQAEAQSQVKKP